MTIELLRRGKRGKRGGKKRVLQVRVRILLVVDLSTSSKYYGNPEPKEKMLSQSNSFVRGFRIRLVKISSRVRCIPPCGTSSFARILLTLE